MAHRGPKLHHAAAPCDFARPGWRVRLRESVPFREGKHADVKSACRWGAGCLGTVHKAWCCIVVSVRGTPCGQITSVRSLCHAVRTASKHAGVNSACRCRAAAPTMLGGTLLHLVY